MTRKRYVITCVVCGARAHKFHPTQTCSRRCMGILSKNKHQESCPVGICPVCKQETKLLYGLHEIRVCSLRCRSTMGGRIFNEQRGIRFHSETRICDECGKEYVATQKRQRCCSIACIRKLHAKPSEHKRQLQQKARDKVRQRLEKQISRCSLCGISYANIITPREFGMRSGSGKSKFQIDHIVPRGNGGDDNIDNVRYVCWFCNVARQDLDSKYDSAIVAAGKAFWEEINKTA